MSLFYLTHREFSLKSTGPEAKEYDLVHRIPGMSLVLFYSKSCPYCDKLKPIFEQLPGQVKGVNIALANVGADAMRIQQMSEASTTRLTYVPYIAVYVDGKFYLEYKGEKSFQSIVKALNEIIAKITTGKNFQTGKMCSSESGQAYCDETYDADTCYITYSEAFEGKPCTNQGKGQCVLYSEAYGGK